MIIVDVARAVYPNCLDRDNHDELCLRMLVQQLVFEADFRGTLDAQTMRRLEIDEEEPDLQLIMLPIE